MTIISHLLPLRNLALPGVVQVHATPGATALGITCGAGDCLDIGYPGRQRALCEAPCTQTLYHRRDDPALTVCGLEVTYAAEGLTGRGLYIGQRGRSWVHLPTEVSGHCSPGERRRMSPPDLCHLTRSHAWSTLPGKVVRRPVCVPIFGAALSSDDSTGKPSAQGILW